MSIEGACRADVTARGKRRQLRGPGGRSGAVQVGAQSCCALFPFVGKSEPRNSHRGRRPTSDNPKQQHKSERLEKRRSGRRRFEFFPRSDFRFVSRFEFRISNLHDRAPIARDWRDKLPIRRAQQDCAPTFGEAAPSRGGRPASLSLRRAKEPAFGGPCLQVVAGRFCQAATIWRIVSSRLTEISHDG